MFKINIDMSRHLVRLLEIDRLLRSSERCTAINLASLLEVSERTIRYDLDFLRDSFHAPLEFDRQKGYHYTDPTWRLPAYPLSKGELFALTLGARMLSAFAGSAYAAELNSAIRLLAERLPEQTWVDLQQLTSEQILFRLGAEIDLKPEIWHSLETACQQKRRVRIDYYTPTRNERSVREVDPYILHFSRNNPYMTGYCHLRQEVRWFRVDRIQSLDLLAQTFEIDPNFDPQEHFSLVFQYEVGGIPTQISIWFDTQTAPYIRERRWHSTQVIEEQTDGSLILHFISRGLSDVKRWVLFYGKGAQVLAPPQLSDLVRDEVRAMHDYYLKGEKK
jgi:predicted DNA-binding transcriptional regulator YafY